MGNQSVRLNKILLSGRWKQDTAPSYPGYRNLHTLFVWLPRKCERNKGKIERKVKVESSRN